MAIEAARAKGPPRRSATPARAAAGHQAERRDISRTPGKPELQHQFGIIVMRMDHIFGFTCSVLSYSG